MTKETAIDFESRKPRRKLGIIVGAAVAVAAAGAGFWAWHGQLAKDGLAKMTGRMARNVHNSAAAPHGENAERSDCHKAHTQPAVYCSKCHDDAEVPEGWLGWDEYKQLQG